MFSFKHCQTLKCQGVNNTLMVLPIHKLFTAVMWHKTITYRAGM